MLTVSQARSIDAEVAAELIVALLAERELRPPFDQVTDKSLAEAAARTDEALAKAKAAGA